MQISMCVCKEERKEGTIKGRKGNLCKEVGWLLSGEKQING